MRLRSPLPFTRWSVALLGACACSTSLGDPDSSAPAQSSASTVSTESSEEPVGTPAPAGRFARLTHTQWENSVRDLLRLKETPGLSQTFPSDARTAGYAFDNDQVALEVDQVLSGAYASAAESLAARVTNDSALLARLLPTDTGNDQERVRLFITVFGERAFRRPLETSEVDAYVKLFELGKTAYDDVSGFTAGVRMLLEAFLRSPFFLYRVESSTAVSGATIPLTGYELAQRLSFLLTNSIPDDGLLAAARTGHLASPSDVRREALRLLATPAAHDAVVGFHDQLLEFEKFENINPSPKVFPSLPASFAESVRTSSRMFIDDLVLGQAGNFQDLMTSSQAFVNKDLAPVYGVSGNFGADFVKVSLPENQRRGIFNQVGFLASNATSTNPDPIHRGVFIATRVLCIGIAAPPDGVPPLPPIQNGTNREIVANHTESSPVCKACHGTIINPLGFTFENYDAAGAYRTMDHGEVVDAHTSPNLDGQQRQIANSVELADALGQSRQAHECYSSHLVEYAFGRKRDPVDDPLISALTDASLGGASIVELIVRIAESPAFVTRSTKELP